VVKNKKIEEEYITFIRENVAIEKPLKIVIDCGNGTTGLFAEKILKTENSEIISLYTDSDGNFPNHLPYPQNTKLYGKLVETIKTGSADFGLAFDGDGDRLGVYSDKGDFIQSDQIAALFAVEILKKQPGATIVLNTQASQSSIEKIKEAGGKVVFAETGYPEMTKTLAETKSPLGAEISGHFFFSDRYFGYDDALYAAARFLEMMSKSEKLLSTLIGELPEYQTTEEFRTEISKSLNKADLIKSLKNTLFKEEPQTTFLEIDGLRFTFPDKSWGLVRFSHTEPVISVRAEGKTAKNLEKVKRIIQRSLTDFDIPLNWEKSAIS
jgi:phosphomannomutase